MQGNISIKRLGTATFAAVMALFLAGCLLSPGKFTSQLDLRNGGTFAYSYDGEIYLLALSKLAEMGNKAELADEEFVEQPCYSDEEFEERTCTTDEIAEQKRDWEANLEGRINSQKKDAEMMSAMLGGIDPADPAAAEELAKRLRRQKGWNSVEYRGDGLFVVQFKIEGRLDHDFLFPTIESFPMSNFFVLVANRDGGTVRVDAPGFSAQSGGNPFQGMMAGMASGFSRMGASSGEDEMPMIPELSGTFRIVTDGEVLANNTDEGPVETSGGKALEWTINKRTQAAPTALIKIAP
ncbi:hypothetical protein [Allopontixanthobacter sediminis]|uniref:Uncharacterized protein n=1 Tax=Allopontixanthobacter sediminis TaxID=1689985 RepID=A0A845B0C3_9SPHN|nr:hypothetical protein [Allopontixanthobacter sediminis]MXP43955.1 hypothetical protein [Allopontixanthobacter sediminis]